MKKRFHLFFILLALISASCLSGSTSGDKSVTDITPTEESAVTDITPAANTSIKFPEEKIPLPKAIDLSQRPEDVELARKVDEAIEKSEFRNARWGVFVVSLKDGRVLVARDAQKTFNPASAQKIMTTAVALDKLGPDFRWRTSVLGNNEIDANGTLNGDLILYGRGAPDFAEQGLANLVEQLKQKGLKRVSGSLVGDASFFRAANLGSGWVWEEAQWYYGAEPSALSYSDNTVLVEIIPAEKNDQPVTVKTTPEAAFISVTNTAMTSDNAARNTVGVHRDLDANHFQIYGEIPRGRTYAARTTMHQPQQWAASELRKALEKNGIVVQGDVKSLDWRTSNVDPANMRELAAVESDTLAEVAKRTNKRSINLNAELMLRTLGHQAREQAEQQNQRKTVLGDDQLGAMVIKNWLSAKGVELGDTVIHDGSGLSRLNFITPETMGRLLVFASQMPSAEIFKNSLPISGTDGTLGGRLSKYRGNVIAKTGTITYVSALAGYAQTGVSAVKEGATNTNASENTENNSGDTLAFVIFCNNDTRSNNSNAVVDRIASAIAGFGDKSQSDDAGESQNQQ